MKESKRKVNADGGDEKPLDNDAVIRAARAVTGNQDSDSDSDGSESSSQVQAQV